VDVLVQQHHLDADARFQCEPLQLPGHHLL
jgi:hypothetical protein